MTQFKIRHTPFMLAAMILALFSCHLSANKIVAYNNTLENGLYLILNEFSDSTFQSKNGVIIPFSQDFLDDNKEGQPIFLEIDTMDFVRLDLANEPQGIEQPDNRINLVLTLSNIARQQLAAFTEKNLHQKVAIVIGGKAVTMHKVREQIDSGKLQITRCTDHACEYLLLELNGNITK